MSIERSLQNAESVTADSSRYVSMSLALRERETGNVLLLAGGKWDRLSGRYTDEAIAPHALPIEKSQIEFLKWWALWQASFRSGTPRDTSLVLCAGARRGGKSHATLLASVAACVDVPNTICWAVVDNFRSRDEVDRAIVENFPGAWFHRRQSPEFSYTFANGSIVRILSADDSEALKAGRCDIGLVVDLQKMTGAALLNVLGGTIDRNGCVLASANPPRRAKAQFVIDLKEKLEESQLEGAKFFGFDPKLNSTISQGARTRFQAIAEVIDPRLADADADGTWVGIGDVAYPNFRSSENVRPLPTLPDITDEITKRKMGRAMPFAAGFDFQLSPYNVAVFVRVFQGLDDRPVFAAVGEVIKEGTEEELLEAIDDSETWSAGNVAACLDASAFWQDASHTKGRMSADILRSHRYHCRPPQKKKTEQAEHARNPDVEDRLSLVNDLLSQRRLIVTSACPRLISALKKCQQKYGKPVGHYSHITDALGYVLWVLTERARPAPQPGKHAPMNLTMRRAGEDYYQP